MVRFISLLIFVNVLMAMIQPFDSRKLVDLETLEEQTIATDDKSQVTLITAVQKTLPKQRAGGLHEDQKDRFKLTKVNQTGSRVIVDAKGTMARSFPEDEVAYDQPEGIEQSLQASTNQKIMYQLELARLRNEQNQIVIDNIVKANLDN